MNAPEFKRPYFHARARCSLWCAGLAAAVNAGVGLLLGLRAWFFPPVAFMNMFATLALVIAPLSLMPGTFLLYWRPGTTPAEQASQPRGRDLVVVTLGLLVALACVAVMAWLVGVAEEPLRELLRKTWLPDRYGQP